MVDKSKKVPTSQIMTPDITVESAVGERVYIGRDTKKRKKS